MVASGRVEANGSQEADVKALSEAIELREAAKAILKTQEPELHARILKMDENGDTQPLKPADAAPAAKTG